MLALVVGAYVLEDDRHELVEIVPSFLQGIWRGDADVAVGPVGYGQVVGDAFRRGSLRSTALAPQNEHLLEMQPRAHALGEVRPRLLSRGGVPRLALLAVQSWEILGVDELRGVYARMKDDAAG